MALRWNRQFRNIGELWMGFVGRRAQSEGDAPVGHYKQFLADIAKVVAGAYVRQTPRVSGLYVADDKGKIGVDSLPADEAHEDAWIGAIERFQEAATDSLQRTQR